MFRISDSLFGALLVPDVPFGFVAQESAIVAKILEELSCTILAYKGTSWINGDDFRQVIVDKSETIMAQPPGNRWAIDRGHNSRHATP